MKKVDYIIVGNGFAAMFFAFELFKRNISFVLFSDKTAASHLSAGVVNPVVLKRFNVIANAASQISVLRDTLDDISRFTSNRYDVNDSVVRVFHEEKEKELWQKKAKKEELISYLDTDFFSLSGVKNEFGVARVKESFRLDVPLFFHDMFSLFDKQIRKQYFDSSAIDLQNKTYQDIRFDKIVYAEGVAVAKNPFFSWLPVVPNKGHRMLVSLSGKKENFIIKKRHFLFQNSAKGEYYYGGTYARENYSLTQVDPKSQQELESGLLQLLDKKDFEVKSIDYSYRATVADRKPILGKHQMHDFLFVLNGMGARGVLNGAYFSQVLFGYAQNNIPLEESINCTRFSVK